MHTDTRLGTFEDVIAGFSAEVERIARGLRDLIDSVHPDAVEVPRPGERTAGYGVGPKKMSDTYVYIGVYQKYVNLGFYHGASLPDPKGLLDGAGKQLRHVKVHSLIDVGQPALRNFVEAALMERREALGLADKPK